MKINDNRRGRTTGGRYTYRPLVEMEPDDYPADSKYWRGRARGSGDGLRRFLSVPEYTDWAELVWPGNEINEMSWKAIAEMNEAALRLAEKGERSIYVLARQALAQHYGECNCTTTDVSDQSCRVCRCKETPEI